MSASIVMLSGLLFPVASPLQELNSYPFAGVGVRMTSVPSS
ncbi:MAG: hypothetical protein R6V36_06650 [Psychroflexus sp.]